MSKIINTLILVLQEMLEKVTLPVSLRHLSLYLPPKSSQKYLGHRYGKAKPARSETMQNVSLGEKGNTTSCALKEAEIES